MPTPEPDDQTIVSLNALRQRRTDDLLSGDIPLTSLLYRRRDRIAANLLVTDVLTTYMSGSGIGPAGVMVILGIADDARLQDLTAEQRGQITDSITASSPSMLTMTNSEMASLCTLTRSPTFRPAAVRGFSVIGCEELVCVRYEADRNR
nr:hypothetical protein [Rhodococcus wratislaviensis]GLK39054.1 hypothetical protein GCM10017611_59240 [Rhodococcus wratislaviensis]